MKKLTTLLLVVSLIATLFVGVGCSSIDDNLVGVAMPTKSLQRWNQDGQNLQDALEAAGYEVDLQYAGDNDVAMQVEQIENMVTKGCKVIVIASIDGSALKEALQEAADAGIQVIAYDRLIMDSDNVDYYTTFDNYMVGTIQGEYIEETLDLANGAGPFNLEVFGGSPDDNNAYFFNQGAMDVLQPYIDGGQLVINSGQTDMQVIAIQSWDPKTAQDRMDNLLTAFYSDKDVDVILSPNDSLAQGITASLESAGYGTADRPYPVLTGQDCDIINVGLMQEGKQSMSVFKDTRTLAEQTVAMVTSIMNDEDPDTNNVYDNNNKSVPSFLCTPVFADLSNLQEILVDSGYYSADDVN